MPRLILCSASPARRTTLRNAGLDPEVIVSGVDEDAVSAPSPRELALTLARLKANAVLDSLPQPQPGDEPMILIGCDSVLDLDGEALGKPADAEDARQRWRHMRGQTGSLITGHHLIVRDADGVIETSRAAETLVRFAHLSDAEIDAYVATGEPLAVAGAFTLDGLGGAFVTSVTGDPHNVVGISLPLLRELLGAAGLAWPTLWRTDATAARLA